MENLYLALNLIALIASIIVNAIIIRILINFRSNSPKKDERKSNIPITPVVNKETSSFDRQKKWDKLKKAFCLSKVVDE